jgi:putative nucleotidyltransferase with HDIG domain
VRPTTRIIVFLACLAGIACSIGLYLHQPALTQKEVSAVLTFSVLSLIGALMPFTMAKHIDASPTFVTLLAGIVLVPSWFTVVAAGTVILASQVIQRLAPAKIVFNVAQYVVALSISAAAYLWLRSRGAIFGDNMSPVSLIAVFFTFGLANSFAISAVIASETSSRFWVLLKRNTLGGFGLDLVVVPFVYIFVKVYLELGVLATSAAAALIIVVRQLHSTNLELQQSNKDVLELTVTTLEARDPYTSGHSRRVSEYSILIGEAIGLSAKQVERLSVAGLLHDVGKIHEAFAPILSKPGKLTAEERAIMESHPIKGAELVRISSHLRDTVDPIRHHHEAWDGSGYPDGLAGSAIPLFARIIAVADTIDAMASDRPYRRGLAAEKIRAELIRMSGVQFDPELLAKLFRSGTIDLILGRACASDDSTGQSEAVPAMSVAG